MGKVWRRKERIKSLRRRLRGEEFEIKKSPRLSDYFEAFLAERDDAGIHSIGSDMSRIRVHVIPELGRLRLDELRPKHIRAMVMRLKGGPSLTGHQLSARSIQSIARIVHVAMRDAIVAELLGTNPVVLRPGDLPPLVDADPDFRELAIYTRDEMRQLLTESPAGIIRTVFQILFCTGARAGESFALRWADLHEESPLWRLTIARSWSTAKQVEKATKTKIVRPVPVHPWLLPRLQEWRSRGWVEVYGREPLSTDLIVPRRIDPEKHWDTKTFGAWRSKVLAELGLRERRTHDTRRTFISLCLDDGADEKVLRRVTHKRPSEVFDQYRQIPWATICAAVAKLRIEGEP